MSELDNKIINDKLYRIEAENANMGEFQALSEEYLTEDTRSQLVSKSRGAGAYKNQTRGKNRFERKKYSKIANQVKSYNQIDMNSLFKQDILQINIPVTGESDNYTVTIKMEGVVNEIAKNIKSNGNKLEFRTIVQALTKVFNTANIYVKCTCDDFCLQADTKIKLLDGTTVTVEELEKKFKSSDKPIYLYSVDESGDFKPGKIKDVWISGGVNKLIKVTLDNGKEIITTIDHPYMLRNGSYLPANELQVGQSLMPLYFGQTTNGYETVKANSKTTTEFYSTYKQVAAALLQNEIEEAKIRSGEDKIAIHHKDFNKNNNSPDNLYPMGFNEHYKYHYDHVMDTLAFEKFKAAREEYRKLVMDHDSEEYKKQAEVMRAAITNYYNTLTDDEKQSNAEQRSKNTKAAWQRGAFNTDARKAADAQRALSLHTPEMNQKAADGIRKYWANLTDEEREAEISRRVNNMNSAPKWNKDKHLSDEDKLHKSQAALNRTPEQKAEHNLKIRDAKILKIFNKLISDGLDLTAENYEKYRSLYYKNSPSLNKYFDNVDEAIKYFKLNHKIIKIEYLNYDLLQPVYDIEVEKYHNFYVDAGVILHNCYRFDHWSIINGYGVNDTAHDPGPGKGIANPLNDKGIGCKHILLTLANGDWMMKVASVINNYIHYAEENLQKAFLKLIFPKLYGIPAEDMANADLLDKETAEEVLETKASFIDAINEYGKNRGRYKAGSNKNPVTNTGGRPAKTEEEPADKTEIANSEEAPEATDENANKELNIV